MLLDSKEDQLHLVPRYASKRIPQAIVGIGEAAFASPKIPFRYRIPVPRNSLLQNFRRPA